MTPVDTGALRELVEKWQSGPYRHVLVDIARALPALLAEVERRRADEVELVEVLTPFAALADQEELHERLVDGYFSLNIGVMNGNHTQSVIRHKLTVTDVRRARSLLAKVRDSA